MFRILLLNRQGPKSFEDLRTVNGEICATFTEAAEKLGLLESDAMFTMAMEDACAEKMSLKKLQHYFALLLYHGRPSNPQKLLEGFLDEMNPQICPGDPNFRPKSVERRMGEVLRNLEYFFRCMGSTCRYLILKILHKV